MTPLLDEPAPGSEPPHPAQPTLPGLGPLLLDDRSDPDFRGVFGALVGRSRKLDVALTRLRLSTLDLTDRELAHLRRVRLLLGEVNAAALDAEAHVLFLRPETAANLRRLAALLHRGRIEVRSAPLGGWAPDFSVFHDRTGSFALLVGPHRFERGTPHIGPVLASRHGPRSAARVAHRFDVVWERAHDIRPALAGILARADRRPHPGIGRRSLRHAESPGKTTAFAKTTARESVDTPPGGR